MSAKCNYCGLHWLISIKQEIPATGYECPHCSSKKAPKESRVPEGARENELQVNNIKY